MIGSGVNGWWWAVVACDAGTHLEAAQGAALGKGVEAAVLVVLAEADDWDQVRAWGWVQVSRLNVSQWACAVLHRLGVYGPLQAQQQRKVPSLPYTRFNPHTHT